ncbi:hypothetical protein [Fundidesulfovibrio soli]|uniref:hypothetical protein n=1 Tax=Fundidesulfovibrio soli TaxID=2922716 RepID=UPI001FAFB4CA|nr:hypothetical protein [Fundidesulfovibrio soli]
MRDTTRHILPNALRALSVAVILAALCLLGTDSQAYKPAPAPGAEGTQQRPTRVYRDDNGQLYYVDDQGALHTIQRRGVITEQNGDSNVFYLKGDERPYSLDNSGRLFYRDNDGTMHFIDESGPGKPIDPLPLLRDSKVYPALQSGKSPSYCASELRKCKERCSGLSSSKRKACMEDCASDNDQCLRMY